MKDKLKWICDELIESLILILYDKNNSKYAGSYEAKNIIKITQDKIYIEDDNINDIQEFLLMGIIRFVDTENKNEIIDIPIRNIYLLYENMSDTFSFQKKLIDLDIVDAFSIENKKIINKGYGLIAFSPYLEDKDLEISEDLVKIMYLAKNFGNMDMQEKFEAIKSVNDMINIYE